MQKFNIRVLPIYYGKVAVFHLHDKKFMVICLIIVPVITKGHEKSTLPSLTIGRVHKQNECGHRGA